MHLHLYAGLKPLLNDQVGPFGATMGHCSSHSPISEPQTLCPLGTLLELGCVVPSGSADLAHEFPTAHWIV